MQKIVKANYSTTSKVTIHTKSWNVINVILIWQNHKSGCNETLREDVLFTDKNEIAESFNIFLQM